MAYDEALAQRLRSVVAEATDGAFAERAMFGGLAFLVGGHIAVAVSGQGGLMLRVDPAQTDRLLAREHAAPFQMRGRAIDGWLRIDDAGVRTRRDLRRWATLGIAHAQALPTAARSQR